MNTTDLLSAVDAEISRLTQVRTLLEEIGESSPGNSRSKVSSDQKPSSPGISAEPKRRGRPKGSKNKAVSFNPEEFAPKRHNISAAGKARIAAAQRARWIEQKGTATAKKAGTVVASKVSTRPAGKTKAAPAEKSVAKTNPKAVVSRKPVPAKNLVAKVAPVKKVITKKPAENTVKKPASAGKSSAKQAPAKATPPTSTSALPDTDTNA